MQCSVSALIFRNTHPGRTTLERHRDLLQPRYRLSAFLELTCTICKEFIDIEAPYQCTFAYIDFSPNSLTATCPFCNILRQAFENYVDETTKPWLIAVHLRLNLDVQICFMLKDSEPYLDHTELHLQLYSTGLFIFARTWLCLHEIRATYI